jgi:preprotein translocase subunit SecY
MTIPGTIAQFLSEGSDAKVFMTTYLTLNSWSGISLYVLFIILFTFFYSYVQINPQQLSENFEKSGRFIPGIKSGIDTERHISKVLARINWIGGPFLALVAALPYVISQITSIPSGMAIGGTSLIIIVSGVLELWNSILSAVTTSNYMVSKNKIEAKIYESKDINNEDFEKLW